MKSCHSAGENASRGPAGSLLSRTATVVKAEATSTAAGDAYLSIGVWDDSPLMPEPQPHEIDSEAGRGFEIISMLSDSIGVIPDQQDSGKTIWAHLRHD